MALNWLNEFANIIENATDKTKEHLSNNEAKHLNHEMKTLSKSINNFIEHYKLLDSYNEDNENTVKMINNEDDENNEDIENYEDDEKCKFCQIELNCGYDNDDLYHCQICHNIYDGCAQCMH
jgi:hypothetical protein